MSRKTKFIPITPKIIEEMFNKDAPRDAPRDIPKTAAQKTDAGEGQMRRPASSRNSRRSSFTSPSYRRPSHYSNGYQKPPVDTKKQWNSDRAQASNAYKFPEKHLSPYIINPEAKMSEKQRINERNANWKVRNGQLYSSRPASKAESTQDNSRPASRAESTQDSSRPSSKAESPQGRDNSFGEKSSQGSVESSQSSGFKTDVETQSAHRYKDSTCQTEVIIIRCVETQTDVDPEDYEIESLDPPVTEMIAEMVGDKWEYNFTGAFMNFDELESAEIWKLQKMLVETTAQVCIDAEHARRAAAAASA